jgi:hypothetical protein
LASSSGESQGEPREAACLVDVGRVAEGGVDGGGHDEGNGAHAEEAADPEGVDVAEAGRRQQAAEGDEEGRPSDRRTSALEREERGDGSQK